MARLAHGLYTLILSTLLAIKGAQAWACRTLLASYAVHRQAFEK
jgi:hypothetical protein